MPEQRQRPARGQRRDRLVDDRALRARVDARAWRRRQSGRGSRPRRHRRPDRSFRSRRAPTASRRRLATGSTAMIVATPVARRGHHRGESDGARAEHDERRSLAGLAARSARCPRRSARRSPAEPPPRDRARGRSRPRSTRRRARVRRSSTARSRSRTRRSRSGASSSSRRARVPMPVEGAKVAAVRLMPDRALGAGATAAIAQHDVVARPHGRRRRRRWPRTTPAPS